METKTVRGTIEKMKVRENGFSVGVNIGQEDLFWLSAFGEPNCKDGDLIEASYFDNKVDDGTVFHNLSKGETINVIEASASLIETKRDLNGSDTYTTRQEKRRMTAMDSAVKFVSAITPEGGLVDDEPTIDKTIYIASRFEKYIVDGYRVKE